MIANKLMPRSLRGFTLTEAAIVLGIVGLILGAIWVAAGTVYNNMRVSTTTTQILQSVQAIRGLYAGSPTLAGATTANLITAGAFPKDLVNGNALMDVWGQTATFGLANANTEMVLTFPAVPQESCITLASRLTGSQRDTGLVSITIAGGAPVTAFPITVATATTSCANATNSFAINFRLK